MCNTCVICMEKTDKIKVRCSCGDASLVCEDCFYEYWNMDDCPYRYDCLPKFKCPICKRVDKRQQLTRLFEDFGEFYLEGNFMKKSFKIIRFIVKKINEKEGLLKCDECCEYWDDCVCDDFYDKDECEK